MAEFLCHATTHYVLETKILIEKKRKKTYSSIKTRRWIKMAKLYGPTAAHSRKVLSTKKNIRHAPILKAFLTSHKK